jgi:hypothetical protein
MRLLVALFSFLFFTSCVQKNDKSQEDLSDKEAIAADTSMQVMIEKSFEFVKDYNFNNKHVYSVVHGGFTAYKNVLILEKKSVNNYDTIFIFKIPIDEKLNNVFLTDFSKADVPVFNVVCQKKEGGFLTHYTIEKIQSKWVQKTLSTPLFYSENIIEIDNNSEAIIYYRKLKNETNSDKQFVEKVELVLRNDRFVVQKIDTVLKP